MDIGRTNKRVCFYKLASVVNEANQTRQVLKKIRTVWASVEPTRGREYQEAQRIRPELTYKITTRYYEDITPDMYIVYKGRQFGITSIINPRCNNFMLEFICVEKQDNDIKAIEDQGAQP